MSGIKEIKLEDLEMDEAFFSSLREEKFILVLGAGFSYGLPNKAGSHIPIVTQFVDLTNEKFHTTISPNEYNIAADEWQRYIEDVDGNSSLSEKRFEEFKDIF